MKHFLIMQEKNKIFFWVCLVVEHLVPWSLSVAEAPFGYAQGTVRMCRDKALPCLTQQTTSRKMSEQDFQDY